jgi:hypothetical protein
MRRQGATHGANVLRRRHHQHHIARRHRREVGRRLQPRVEGDAGQERCVGPAAGNLGDDLGLARPDQRIAAGAAHGLRQRRAPRSSSHDPDAAERHLRLSPAILEHGGV